MSVPLTGPGGLFTRLGRLGKILLLLNADQAALPAYWEQIHDQYEAADGDLVGAMLSARDSLTRQVSAAAGVLSGLAQETVLRMVAADEPGAGRSLDAALAELRRQMRASGDSVTASTVGAAAAAVGTPTGTGVVVLSTKRGDGLTQENIVAEVARLTCTADSYTGGRSAGQEQFQLVGAAAAGGVLDYDWPQGSNGFLTVTCTSPTQDASSTGNLLTNGDFETWSGSPVQLENWAIGSGVWGTDVRQTNTTPFLGTYCAKVPSGATPVVYAQFGSTAATGSSAGTNATPRPLTSYAVNLWVRQESSALTTGTLRVRLCDDSGTTVNDEQGTANSTTFSLADLTTTYAAKNVVFQLPAILPAVIRLEWALTVAPDQDILLDDFGMTPLSAVAGSQYGTAPGLAIFRGATPFKSPDAFDLRTRNNRGGASYAATFQALLLRLFGLPGFILPSAGSPTIADSLITS